MILPTYTSKATDSLCREIAKKSKGVCFLGLSTGKDSLCAWLNLRRYGFSRIIPFHCSSIPHWKFVRHTLDSYQYEFNTRILRLMGEDLTMALMRHIYQESPWICDLTDEMLDQDDYSKLDILEYLRNRFNLPKAWCAFGISASDSIDRRIYCNKTGGKSDINRTFYPCWDWPRSEIVKAIRESGLKLCSTYRYAKRSIGGVPCATYNRILREHYPDDYREMLKWYPLAEAKDFREQMLDEEWRRRKDEEIAKNGGKEPAESSQSEEGEFENEERQGVL